jgi:cell division protein FtsQ
MEWRPKGRRYKKIMSRDDIDDLEREPEEEEEKESAFRRRGRAVPVRRGRGSRWRRLAQWACLSLLVLIPLGYGGYRLAEFGSTSPEFSLTSAEDVILTGNQYVSRDEAINALGLPPAGRLSPGLNIFKMSMEEKRRQLEAIPWVERATLTRAYPNRLAVHLEERVPVAFIHVAGHLKLVDRHGVLLEKPERARFDFPVVTGLDAVGGPAERASRLSVYLDFTREVANEAATAGWMISEVDLADPDDLKALLAANQETIQVHFGHGSFAERFRNFLTLLPELKTAGAPVDSIDLRYGRQVVVNPKSPAPAEVSQDSPAGIREN